MRFTAMMAGAAVVLAACGGAKTDAGANPDSNKAAAPAPTAAAGTQHVVNMVMEGTAYKFVPADITIKAGDAVVFKGVSGAAHNIVFWADSIPTGAGDLLTKAMPDGTAPLSSKMVPDGDSTVVSFAGLPAGTYKMYCLPHMAMGMKGSITVTP
jgi:plastocyanin